MSNATYAYYPITSLDSTRRVMGHTVGWLVEGILDEEKLRTALHQVVTKWPVLAGRIEPHGSSHRIKVPLGKLEEGYLPFVLTSSDSDLPISHFVELPLASISNNLPASLFKSPLAPASPSHWFQRNLPFTYWHLTHFRQPGKEYTCLGLTFSHMIFDGMGIASVIHTVEAETLGRPWTPPPPLLPIEYDNALQTALDAKEKEAAGTLPEYHFMENVNAWYTICKGLWYFWQRIWYKAQSRIIIVPSRVCDSLVRDAREAIAKECKDDVRISTGDVLAAWLLKTIYSVEPASDRKICIANQMCMRKLFNLSNYPHNCFMQLPYPLFTVSEIHATSISSLAYKFSVAKSSVTTGHGLMARKHFKKNGNSVVKGTKFFCVTADTRADETLLMTNVSNGRVVNVDWTGLDGRKTIFRYKTTMTRSRVSLSNFITIMGKMEDGSMALDAVLNQKRMKALVDEVTKLSADIIAQP